MDIDLTPSHRPRHRRGGTRRVGRGRALLAAGAVTAAGVVPLATAYAETSATHHAHDTAALQQLTFAPTDDAYASLGAPHMNKGLVSKLVTSDIRGNAKVTYLRFAVEGLPDNASGVHATLRLTRDVHHLPSSTLTVRSASAAWSERTLTAANAPITSNVLATANVGRSVDVVTFDVSAAVQHDGTVAFALSGSSTTDVARFHSRQAGSSGPALLVSYTSDAAQSPTPEPSTTVPSSEPPTSLPPSTEPPTSPPTTEPPTTEPPTTEPPTSPPTTQPPSEPPTSPPPTSPPPGTKCGLSKLLVPSCGVLLGAYTTGFGGSTLVDHTSTFEKAIGRPLDVVHDYRRPGNVLSPYDKQIATTPGKILQLNYKPVNRWADGDGSNAAVNAQIDGMADSIKSIAPTKIFLAIFHEPENDVSGGVDCKLFKGSAGTPAQYRAMWANVRHRFDARGVTNVVWVMNYMGASNWACMNKALWPGNDLVDWIMWDPYVFGDHGSFESTVGYFYHWMEQNSDAQHDFTSKPWGLGEFGTAQHAQSGNYSYYDGIPDALAHSFPRIKLISVFDAIDPIYDLRLGYDFYGHADPAETRHFAAAVDNPVLATTR